MQVVDEAAVSGVTVIFSNCAYSLKRKLIACNLLEVRPHIPLGPATPSSTNIIHSSLYYYTIEKKVCFMGA